MADDAREEKKQLRRATSKKGIDEDDYRAKRTQLSVNIRKAQREDALFKRRQLNMESNPSGPVYVEGANEYDEVVETDESIQREIFKASEALRSGNFPLIKEAVGFFRKQLSKETNPPTDAVIASGAVPVLIDLLSCPDHEIQFEAAWALTNIGSGASEHTATVVNHGAVPKFVGLLRSPHANVSEQAVWALGNIAGDRASYRDMVISAGALHPLLELITPATPLGFLRNCVWTLSNFFRSKPAPNFQDLTDAIPYVVQTLFSNDAEVLADALWTLSYITDSDNKDVINAIIGHGAIRQVVQILAMQGQGVNILTPALRVVGNIVSMEGEEFTDAVVNVGGANALAHLLTTCSKRGVVKEAVWTMSNILAGSVNQIETVIQSGAIPVIINLMSAGPTEIKREAVWAISNATAAANDQQIHFLVRSGCIGPLVDAAGHPMTVSYGSENGGGHPRNPRTSRPYTSKELDDILKCATVALEGLENILRCGGVLAAAHRGAANPFVVFCMEARLPDILEDLQTLQSPNISRKAASLIANFFAEDGEYVDGDDNEDHGVAGDHQAGPPGDGYLQEPTVIGGQFVFGANAPSPFYSPQAQHPQQQYQQGGFFNQAAPAPNVPGMPMNINLDTFNFSNFQ